MNKPSPISATVALYAAGGAAIYFAIKKLIPDLAGKIFDDAKDVADVDSELSKGSASAFSPLFWQAEPAKALKISNADIITYTNAIYNSVGFITDDFSQCYSVFQRLKTRSQVSYLSDWFQRKYGKDLLAWLRGTMWPVDHFSDKEVAMIIKYVNKLPAYQV